MIIHENKWYLLKYDDSIKTLFAVWMNIDEMTDNLYKEQLEHYIKSILQYRPEKVLIDISEGYYPLNEEMLKWNEKNIASKVENSNVTKIAFVMPKSLLHSMVVEHIIANINRKSKIQRKIFYTYDKAMEWIME